MTRKSIAIGLPTFGMTSMRWAMAYRDIQFPMNCKVSRAGALGLEIGVARNAIVQEVLAMESKPTHLFFLDDDVIPATPWVVIKLYQHDLPIVGGVYFHKGDYGEPLVFNEPGYGTVPYDPRITEPVKVWGIHAGLTMYQTDLFRLMASELDLGTDGRGNPRWFYTRGDKLGEDKATEDMYFCEQVHKLGIAPHVDMSAECFGWHYDATQSQHDVAYPRKQWQQFKETGTISWEVPNS